MAAVLAFVRLIHSAFWRRSRSPMPRHQHRSANMAVGNWRAAYRHSACPSDTGITSTGLTTDPSLEAAKARSISAKG